MKSKMKFLSWMLLSSLFLVSFTACGGDDDEKTDNTDYAEKVEGDYVGTISVPSIQALGITAQTIENVTIGIEYKSANKVILTLNQLLPIATGQLPLNVACECTTSNQNGKTKISGSGVAPVEGIGNLPVTIDGTIDANGKADIKISVSMGIISIPVTFSGQQVI